MAASYEAIIQPFATLGSCVASADASCLAAALAPPIVVTGLVALALGIACYALSYATGNDSWVDRSWSIVPPLHCWLYVYLTHDPVFVNDAKGNLRVTALGGYALVTSVWGLRLTYNFWRRGGYERGGEDYRWEHVRQWPVWKNRVLWNVFSFWFISVFQQWLLWAITVPAATRVPGRPATAVDKAVMLAMLLLIAVETMADQQQWNFQNEKRSLKPRRASLEADYILGFLTHGLFARSRHPNVWAEQNIWIALYAGTIANWGLLNYAGLGALALLLLTLRSCVLTEQLALAKYPQYAAYRRAVPMLVPSVFSCHASLDAALDRMKVKTQ